LLFLSFSSCSRSKGLSLTDKTGATPTFMGFRTFQEGFLGAFYGCTSLNGPLLQRDNLRLISPLGKAKFIISLKVDPETCRTNTCSLKPYRQIRTDASMSVNDARK
jgi:hypothetical protein